MRSLSILIKYVEMHNIHTNQGRSTADITLVTKYFEDFLVAILYDKTYVPNKEVSFLKFMIENMSADTREELSDLGHNSYNDTLKRLEERCALQAEQINHRPPNKTSSLHSYVERFEITLTDTYQKQFQLTNEDIATLKITLGAMHRGENIDDKKLAFLFNIFANTVTRTYEDNFQLLLQLFANYPNKEKFLQLLLECYFKRLTVDDPYLYPINRLVFIIDLFLACSQYLPAAIIFHHLKEWHKLLNKCTIDNIKWAAQQSANYYVPIAVIEDKTINLKTLRSPHLSALIPVLFAAKLSLDPKLPGVPPLIQYYLSDYPELRDPFKKLFENLTERQENEFIFLLIKYQPAICRLLIIFGSSAITLMQNEIIKNLTSLDSLFKNIPAISDKVMLAFRRYIEKKTELSNDPANINNIIAVLRALSLLEDNDQINEVDVISYLHEQKNPEEILSELIDKMFIFIDTQLDTYIIVKYGDDTTLAILTNLLSFLSPHLKLEISNDFPPVIQYILFKFPKIENEFKKFYANLSKINTNAPEAQQLDVKKLLENHQGRIYRLLMIFGVTSGLQLMKAQLAGTLLTLERFLDNILIIPPEIFHAAQKYVEKNKDKFESNLLMMTTFINVLNVISILYDKDVLSSGELISYLESQKTSTEILIELTKPLVIQVLGDLNVTLSEEEILHVFEHISPEYFIRLVTASNKMVKDIYRDIYLKLVACDLTGRNVDDILHHVSQQKDDENDQKEKRDEVAEKLSQHNQNIRELLVATGIQPKTALAYDKTLDFVVSEAQDSDENVRRYNQLLTLWHDAEQVLTQVNNLLVENPEHTEENKLKAIKTNITKLKEHIEKENKAKKNNSAAIVTVLNKEVSVSLLSKINANLKALDANKTSLPDGFFEFSHHYQDRFAELTKSNVSTTKTTKTTKAEMHYFRIKQWNKNDPYTFFLGDEVGCCLATNNAQFQAMVQRRMDDALLFKVAVDLTTGKPAALLWVYLAKNTDDEIVCMVNFAEVNAKFGSEPNLRKPILDNLLRFTLQYCEDNKIKKLYVNQLGYGWNKGDLDHFEIKSCDLADKLGGPLTLNPYEEGVTTSEKYYLVSLDNKEFHHIESEVLQQNLDPHGKLVLDIMKAAIAKCADEKDIDAISKKVAQEHSFELTPFYSAPLENDKKFLEDVTKIWREMHVKQSSSEASLIASSVFTTTSPGLQENHDIAKSHSRRKSI